MKKAKFGNIIKWTNMKHNVELTGKVRKIYTNSVLVDLEPTPLIDELELWESTIVAHKNYTVIIKEIVK
ncbi:MAG: DUF2187 family protein [Kurthia sp.]|nr:DUF2187 family protein [Candidatus Kurthia equi]